MVEMKVQKLWCIGIKSPKKTSIRKKKKKSEKKAKKVIICDF